MLLVIESGALTEGDRCNRSFAAPEGFCLLYFQNPPIYETLTVWSVG